MWVAIQSWSAKGAKGTWIWLGIGILGTLIGIGVSGHKFAVDRGVRETAERIERKVDRTVIEVASGAHAVHRATESFRRKGCGEYRHWVRNRCVDARNRSP